MREPLKQDRQCRSRRYESGVEQRRVAWLKSCVRGELGMSGLEMKTPEARHVLIDRYETILFIVRVIKDMIDLVTVRRILERQE